MDSILGAYVPLTMERNILVDGVQNSCCAITDHTADNIAMTLCPCQKYPKRLYRFICTKYPFLRCPGKKNDRCPHMRTW